MEKIKIGIIGVGMVGAPLLRWFFEKGWKRNENLFCFDTDPNKGFSDDVFKANIIFICVPTPPDSDGACDTSIVESVVSRFADSGKVLVIKSTVPPETIKILAEKYNCIILFNPEFLTEAQAWEDFIRPDRQIVAAADEKARKWIGVVLNLLPIGSFQSPGVEGTYCFYETDSTEAETAKYGGNVFGAMKVVFANVIADLCELLGVDYENVRSLISHDRRIGGAWMDINHGNYRGFGGFCFPKDLDALIVRYSEKLTQAAIKDEKSRLKHESAIGFLKSIRDYNEALLESQDLSLREVCHHDEQVCKNIKNRSTKTGRKK